MINFDKAFDLIISPGFEGNKTTNTPGDLGGKTRCGLTQKNYNNFRVTRKLDPQDIELANISEIKEWYQIYCWDDAGCDKIFLSGRDKLAFAVFQYAVNRSYVHAVENLQIVLGLDMKFITGYLGPITLDLVSKCNEQEIIDAFLGKQEAYYQNHVIEHPDQHIFLHSWLQRIDMTRKVIKEN